LNWTDDAPEKTLMRGLMKTTVLAVSALAALSHGRASANLVLNYASNSPILAGSPPETPGAYLTATFANSTDDASILAGHVRLTLAVPTAVPGLFVGAVGFNLNTSTAPTLTLAPGTLAAVASFDPNGLKLVGTGDQLFNTLFDFPQAGSKVRLGPGSPSVYDIAGLRFGGDLTKLLAGNADGYTSGAHIQGYGNSVGIAGEPVPPLSAPEPSTLVMAGAAVLFGLGYARRRGRSA